MIKSALKPRVVHGTPITAKRYLQQLAGESFCVSFHRPDQIEDVLPLQDKNGILVLDNGAFSHWKTTGGNIDREAYFAWANAIQERCEVAVAVIPDVIEGGTEESNWLEAAHAVRGGLAQFPERCMFIWHMNESIDQLKRAALLFNFIGIGSCAEFDVQRNRKGYMAKLREAAAVLQYVEVFYGRRPWVHLMRGLGVLTEALIFNSGDSTNLALNHCRTKAEPNHVRKFSNRIRSKIALASAAAPVRPAAPTSNFGEIGRHHEKSLPDRRHSLRAREDSGVGARVSAVCHDGRTQRGADRALEFCGAPERLGLAPGRCPVRQGELFIARAP